MYGLKVKNMARMNLKGKQKQSRNHKSYRFNRVALQLSLANAKKNIIEESQDSTFINIQNPYVIARKHTKPNLDQDQDNNVRNSPLEMFTKDTPITDFKGVFSHHFSVHFEDTSDAIEQAQRTYAKVYENERNR